MLLLNKKSLLRRDEVSSRGTTLLPGWPGARGGVNMPKRPQLKEITAAASRFDGRQVSEI